MKKLRAEENDFVAFWEIDGAQRKDLVMDAQRDNRGSKDLEILNMDNMRRDETWLMYNMDKTR
jgi:hypothetical protein